MDYFVFRVINTVSIIGTGGVLLCPLVAMTVFGVLKLRGRKKSGAAAASVVLLIMATACMSSMKMMEEMYLEKNGMAPFCLSQGEKAPFPLMTTVLYPVQHRQVNYKFRFDLIDMSLEKDGLRLEYGRNGDHVVPFSLRDGETGCIVLDNWTFAVKATGDRICFAPIEFLSTREDGRSPAKLEKDGSFHAPYNSFSWVIVPENGNLFAGDRKRVSFFIRDKKEETIADYDLVRMDGESGPMFFFGKRSWISAKRLKPVYPAYMELKRIWPGDTVDGVVFGLDEKGGLTVNQEKRG